MSDGLAWADEQLKEEKNYLEHVASGNFDKRYLEQDIARVLNSSELRLLVVRLIIHHLGGFKKFFAKEKYGFIELFNGLTKKEQKVFVKHRAEDLGMEVGYTDKLSKLKSKLESLLK